MNIDDVTWDDLNEHEQALLMDTENLVYAFENDLANANNEVNRLKDELRDAEKAVKAAEDRLKTARRLLTELEAGTYRRVAERIGSDE